MNVVKEKESSIGTTSRSPVAMPRRSIISSSHSLPLIVTLNCIEDTSLEQECLAGIAAVEHVSLSRLVESKIESAAAVLLHSLAFLPRAAQRRLRPWQLIICLGSSDRSVDSALAVDLGLQHFVHVNVSRSEEIADTVMALILGLLRRTHLLLRHTMSASGWLGSVQPLCRGMRRCRGLVLGIIGKSASAMSLATRCLAFKMSVLYFDVQEGKGKMNTSSAQFPSAARRMDTLNDLLAASDIISLHCTVTNETVQIINADCLQHVKPGAFLVNAGSSQLLDDCAVKQLLIDGTLAGCALDGADGPQWMEAWVREMPNVLLLPRSADYSEEVWIEIREKVISLLRTFFLENIFPMDAVSDEDEVENEIDDKEGNDGAQQGSSFITALTDVVDETPSPHQGVVSVNTSIQSEGKGSRSGKKSKKRNAHKSSQQKPDDPPAMSSSSRKAAIESVPESSSDPTLKRKECSELLKGGCVIALHVRDGSALHVSRQRVKGGGWFLDTISNVTKRDPAAQFLVVSRSKDTIGLRSFTAGGKLLQINRKMEFVFGSHSFEVWSSWTFEEGGGSLEECRLVNCSNPLAVLDVSVEILASVGKEDGVIRWLP
ncbi:C-terminal binding protein AN-like isoform X2 [Impatiens glandulifera]|uniref:C-terminal binding protein AN-like isoform X2 n=1 Tax=Impatiens glandulifera TaxID=253017 RepID=UPI001FB13237|nr:C-terminal binding protein AN-like isoform X2 [Impatiens glandulifera]